MSSILLQQTRLLQESQETDHASKAKQSALPWMHGRFLVIFTIGESAVTISNSYSSAPFKIRSAARGSGEFSLTTSKSIHGLQQLHCRSLEQNSNKKRLQLLNRLRFLLRFRKRPRLGQQVVRVPFSRVYQYFQVTMCGPQNMFLGGFGNVRTTCRALGQGRKSLNAPQAPQGGINS